MNINLPTEREGLQMAKFFLDYCFEISERIDIPPPNSIVESCILYSDKICEKCGAAMDCTHCPVHRYREDFFRFKNGEKTIYSKDFSKITIDIER